MKLPLQFGLFDSDKNFVADTNCPPKLTGYTLIPCTEKTYYQNGTASMLQQTFSGRDNCIYFYTLKAAKRTGCPVINTERRIILLYILDNVIDSIHRYRKMKFREGFCYLVYLPGNLNHRLNINGGSTSIMQLDLPVTIISELAVTHSWLCHFLENHSNNSSIAIAHKEVRITPEMYKEIDRIKSYGFDKRDFEYFLKIRTEILLFEYVNAVSRLKDNIDASQIDLLSSVERILLATRIIDDNQGPKLSIRDLSRLVGLSRQKLQVGFKSLHDITVDKYQTQIRMQRAQKLLLDNPSMPIREIAEHVGYTEESNFTKVFKIHNKLKLTPLQYRRKYEKNYPI